MATISPDRTCGLCGGDCSNAARLKDDSGQYYHEHCYQASLNQDRSSWGDERQHRQSPVSHADHHVQKRTGSGDTNICPSFLIRIWWIFIHAIGGAVFGFFGAFYGGSGGRKLQAPRENVDPDSLVNVMVFCSIFFAIGAIVGGKRGWFQFEKIYSAKLASDNRLHLACIAILVLLVLYSVVQFVRIDAL